METTSLSVHLSFEMPFALVVGIYFLCGLYA